MQPHRAGQQMNASEGSSWRCWKQKILTDEGLLESKSHLIGNAAILIKISFNLIEKKNYKFVVE